MSALCEERVDRFGHMPDQTRALLETDRLSWKRSSGDLDARVAGVRELMKKACRLTGVPARPVRHGIRLLFGNRSL